MVVGKHQSLVGHHFAGAAVAKNDHGILERRLVKAVNLIGREAAAHLLHGFDIHLFQERQQPHPFVGSSTKSQARSQQNSK